MAVSRRLLTNYRTDEVDLAAGTQLEVEMENDDVIIIVRRCT